MLCAEKYDNKPGSKESMHTMMPLCANEGTRMTLHALSLEKIGHLARAEKNDNRICFFQTITNSVLSKISNEYSNNSKQLTKHLI